MKANRTLTIFSNKVTYILIYPKHLTELLCWTVYVSQLQTFNFYLELQKKLSDRQADINFKSSLRTRTVSVEHMKLNVEDHKSGSCSFFQFAFKFQKCSLSAG